MGVDNTAASSIAYSADGRRTRRLRALEEKAVAIVEKFPRKLEQSVAASRAVATSLSDAPASSVAST